MTNKLHFRVFRVFRGFTRKSDLLLIVLLLLGISTPLHAQSASLLGIPGQRAALTLSDNSFCFQELQPPKQLQLEDTIVVIVKETSQYAAEGEVDRRKRANIDARLQDWIFFRNADLKPAPQSDGDPRIRASLNSQLRAEMEMDTSELMQFRIAVKVVDIRPNGTLVVAGDKKIQNNNEMWIYKLSGIVSRDDVLPNKTVLSERIVDLKIEKCESGHVRDGYKRGWLTKWIDLWKPF